MSEEQIPTNESTPDIAEETSVIEEINSTEKTPIIAPVNTKSRSVKKKDYPFFVGRRKTSIASVRLFPGTGQFIVNRKPHDVYFTTKDLSKTVKRPLLLLGLENKFDCFVRVKGGGVRGQAEAILLAVSRSLSHNSEDIKKQLRARKFLTRDPRMVERKKYGLHKARRAVQFSKR